MNYDINYRGLVISTEINQDITKISFEKNSNKYTLNISDRVTSKSSKSIDVPFSLKIEDIDGNVLSATSDKCSVKGSTYDYFYNLVATRSIGQFLDRGSVNLVLEYYFKEQVYPFNILKNYDEMQPIIFDYTVVGKDITVDLVDFDATKTVQYSLDGEVWQQENSFTNLENGQYTIYVQTVEDEYRFSKQFSVNTEVVEG